MLNKINSERTFKGLVQNYNKSILEYLTAFWRSLQKFLKKLIYKNKKFIKRGFPKLK